MPFFNQPLCSGFPSGLLFKICKYLLRAPYRQLKWHQALLRSAKSLQHTQGPSVLPGSIRFIYWVTKFSFKSNELLYDSPTCHNLNSIRKREVSTSFFTWAPLTLHPTSAPVSIIHNKVTNQVHLSPALPWILHFLLGSTNKQTN